MKLPMLWLLGFLLARLPHKALDQGWMGFDLPSEASHQTLVLGKRRSKTPTLPRIFETIPG